MALKKYVPRSIQNIFDRLEAFNESITAKLFSEDLAKTFEVIVYCTKNPETKTSNPPTDNSTDVANYNFYKARSTVGHHDHLVAPEKARSIDEYERLRNMHFQATLKKAQDDELPQTGDVWLATQTGAGMVSLISFERYGDPNKFMIPEGDGPAQAAYSLAQSPTSYVGNGSGGGSSESKWVPTGNELVIQGSHWPNDPIKSNKKISLTNEIKNEYIPARDIALASEPKGLRLLATAMAIKEGFYAKNFGKDYRGVMYNPSTKKTGTRSYRYNNPGNIGNTDSGNNVGYQTLEAGIKAQAKYVRKVATGKHSAYPLGKKKNIKPYHSKEIAQNQKAYGGKDPVLPGYVFTYTGQLDQFVKIYATASRSSNKYLSTIISYFNENGIKITNESKIQDIIEMN